MSVVQSCLDLPGGDPKLAAPSAAHRSWVTFQGAGDAIELAASFERAPEAPMGDFHLKLIGSDPVLAHLRNVRRLRSPSCPGFASVTRPTTPPKRPR